ncbi:class I SAM-dependent DNA methyltransferase [Mycoplasmopsis adleri]|uniref:HsdM family class I SAM-dependent methyltransferase n=1 Tax=Mycoplasmopsis adleri TaxID=51362 RepID=UPI003872B62E
MANYVELDINIKSIIDDLKGLCSTNGLSNTAGEEIVVTSVFLYKFLNDKFIANLKAFAKDINVPYEEIITNNEYMDGFYDSYPQDVAFSYEDTIDYLIGDLNNSDFYKKFDETLVRISNYDKNDAFSVDTAEGTKKPLFTPLSSHVEPSKRNAFAKSIFSYITRDRFDFGGAFEDNYDFFSTIFEYLISDYNTASGKYAEYFTPQALSKAIAQILVRMSPVEDRIYEIYDPSAGSGSLVLHLANELGDGKLGNKARVYTQDISQKSSRFLRINMLLNGLKESLENIIEGDTLTTPAHFKTKGDNASGLKCFDYITSNPPFKTDFSSTRDTIERMWSATDRFFAGVPTIPNKKKDSMAIYLLFIQHILYSLKDDGKAAIVVPTGFITAQSGIEKAIRQKIVDNHWLKGVISMPSNIFANTGTNVSVLFIDKTNSDGEILLMDASKMGHKEKIKDLQKTVLTPEELNKIVDDFVGHVIEDDFTVSVTYDAIKEKNYSLSAGQYFDVKIEYVDISQEEYDKMIDDFTTDFAKYVDDTTEFQKEISQTLKELKVKW